MSRKIAVPVAVIPEAVVETVAPSTVKKPVKKKPAKRKSKSPKSKTKSKSTPAVTYLEPTSSLSESSSPPPPPPPVLKSELSPPSPSAPTKTTYQVAYQSIYQGYAIVQADSADEAREMVDAGDFGEQKAHERVDWKSIGPAREMKGAV